MTYLTVTSLRVGGLRLSRRVMAYSLAVRHTRDYVVCWKKPLSLRASKLPLPCCFLHRGCSEEEQLDLHAEFSCLLAKNPNPS